MILTRFFISLLGLSIFFLGCGHDSSRSDAGQYCSGQEDCQPGYVCLGGECIVRPECLDLDEDSFCDWRDEGDDCNDNRADVHPRAEEICDKVDNDCDGEIDEECPCIPEEIQPCGVNQGICRKGSQVCQDGKWGGCEDGVMPQAWDDCSDNLDNNCDGVVDEDCPCYEIGETRECGARIGECTSGVQTCVAGNDGGRWGGCAWGTPPREEICDDELDNDCDGAVDNGCPCTQKNRPCGISVGLCHSGTQTCKDGRWGSCEHARWPADELCDGFDNDCDRLTDEGCECIDGRTETCGTDVGECRAGTRICFGGRWGSCGGDLGPTPEICDGRDNDCDTAFDEDFTDLGQACQAGTGVCVRPGINVCASDGSATVCSATPGTGAAEVCDGVDNDCDGVTDEEFQGVGQTCSIGQSRCLSSGVTVCGPFGIVCNATVIFPENERCDGIDNDCDNLTDENFPLKGQQCAAGIGQCFVRGIYVCPPDGGPPLCNASPSGSRTEECNGLDDDCDGLTDEHAVSCSSACGSGYRACIDGKPGPCSAPEPQPEVCDYIDNDCDGWTDEDFEDIGRECRAGTGACLSLGYFVCDQNGGTKCNAVPGTPQTENFVGGTCWDGIDNDCDGRTDCDPGFWCFGFICKCC